MSADDAAAFAADELKGLLARRLAVDAEQMQALEALAIASNDPEPERRHELVNRARATWSGLARQRNQIDDQIERAHGRAVQEAIGLLRRCHAAFERKGWATRGESEAEEATAAAAVAAGWVTP